MNNVQWIGLVIVSLSSLVFVVDAVGWMARVQLRRMPTLAYRSVRSQS